MSKDWLGVEGAKLIEHGYWNDAEVKYEGLLYNASELWEMIQYEYEDYCKENGIKPTEDSIEEWNGLSSAALNALYDAYPTEVDEILNPEEFEVRIAYLDIDLEGNEDYEDYEDYNRDLSTIPFKEGDIVPISEVVSWVESTSFKYDLDYEVDDDDESLEICLFIHHNKYGAYSDKVFSMTLENNMGEYYPKAAGAMKVLF